MFFHMGFLQGLWFSSTPSEGIMVGVINLKKKCVCARVCMRALHWTGVQRIFPPTS